MIVGGIVLLGRLRYRNFNGRRDSDPSTEISQIIEKKENPESSENKEEEESEKK